MAENFFAPSRFVERWWHFGRCPRCGSRYSDWFIDTKSKGLPRYCYPCSDAAPRASIVRTPNTLPDGPNA